MAAETCQDPRQNGPAIRALRQRYFVAIDGDPYPMSQRELARRVGVAQGFISRIESEDCNVSAPTLQRIAQALRISPDAITRHRGDLVSGNADEDAA